MFRSRENKIAIKVGAIMLAAGMLLSGCSKADEKKKGTKKSSKSAATTNGETNKTSGKNSNQNSNSNSNSNSNTSSSTNSASGSSTAPQDTYHIGAELWACDVPDIYKCVKTQCIDTDKETYFEFWGDPDHPDFNYIIVSIRSEDLEGFQNAYRYYFSMVDYAEGNLPTTDIGGYGFISFESMHFGTEIDVSVKHYVYRHEASGMTIDITVNDYTMNIGYKGDEFLENIEFALPDLGLSDPDFAFEKGEYQSTVTAMPLSSYTVTPSQAHFDEHVFVTSEGGIVRFSSTATHAAASEKYLYTCDIRSSIVYIYQITDEEMTKVAEVVAGFEDVTVDLLDGDTVAFYADPYGNYLDHFFIVESTEAGDRVMSCLNDVAVSPDGSVIFVHNPLANELHVLHLDPITNTVTAEPMELDQVPLECWDLQYVFVTSTSIFIRFYSYKDNNESCTLVEYDHEGKMIKKWEDDTLENMCTYSLHEFGGNFLVMDQGEDTLRLMDHSGHTIESVLLSELIGIDDMEFTHYSLLKRNDQGDFLLLYAYENGGILEDMVFHIHIA
ncbi:MAG: hypothetical protein J5636_00655 [Clostridiales bacterium]|nr:hypothetical protein [Clostridiales bacterium]